MSHAEAVHCLMGLMAEFQLEAAAGIVAAPWSMSLVLTQVIFDHSYGSEMPSGWRKWFQVGYRVALKTAVVQQDKEVGGDTVV